MRKLQKTLVIVNDATIDLIHLHGRLKQMEPEGEFSVIHNVEEATSLFLDGYKHILMPSRGSGQKSSYISLQIRESGFRGMIFFSYYDSDKDGEELIEQIIKTLV